MSNKSISKLDSYALTTIALLAVFVSIWQANHQRKHDRLSLMPYVNWTTYTTGDTTKVGLWNKGNGPAIITDYTFLVNDSTFTSWNSALSYADSTIVTLGSRTFGSYILAPNEEIVLISYKAGETQKGGMRINITFESVYGDQKQDYLISGL